MADQHEDRRRHFRVEIVREIFVEVVRRGSRSEADNAVLKCQTVDVSVSGLKLLVPEPITAGSRLNISQRRKDFSKC